MEHRKRQDPANFSLYFVYLYATFKIFLTTSLKPINAAFIFEYWILRQKNIIFVLNIAWRLMSSFRFCTVNWESRFWNFVNGMLSPNSLCIPCYWKVQVLLKIWIHQYFSISQTKVKISQTIQRIYIYTIILVQKHSSEKSHFIACLFRISVLLSAYLFRFFPAFKLYRLTVEFWMSTHFVLWKCIQLWCIECR